MGKEIPLSAHTEAAGAPFGGAPGRDGDHRDLRHRGQMPHRVGHRAAHLSGQAGVALALATCFQGGEVFEVDDARAERCRLVDGPAGGRPGQRGIQLSDPGTAGRQRHHATGLCPGRRLVRVVQVRVLGRGQRRCPAGLDGDHVCACRRPPGLRQPCPAQRRPRASAGAAAEPRSAPESRLSPWAARAAAQNASWTSVNEPFCRAVTRAVDPAIAPGLTSRTSRQWSSSSR